MSLDLTPAARAPSECAHPTLVGHLPSEPWNRRAVLAYGWRAATSSSLVRTPSRSTAHRATGDLDVFVRPEGANAERVYRALVRFGAPVENHGVKPEDFVAAGTVYQMGLPPRRIDVLTSISGVTFEAATRQPVSGRLGDAIVRSVSLTGYAVVVEVAF